MNQNELNNMREQLEILKRKIEHEERMGEKQIRRAMRKKMSYINRQGLFFVLLALSAIPFFIWSRRILPISDTFCWVTCGFLAVAALYTHLIHSKLSAEDITQEHLVTVARKLTALKRSYTRWLFFSIPFLVFWICWYIRELKTILSPEIYTTVLIGCAVGGVIGGLIGTYKHIRVQRSCSEMLEQIEDITKES